MKWARGIVLTPEGFAENSFTNSLRAAIKPPCRTESSAQCETCVSLSSAGCQTCWERHLSLPAHLLVLVRLSQCFIKACFAHAARLATLALGESMRARWAPELDSGRRATLSVGINWGSFRPALYTFLAEDVLALHAYTCHERPRMGRKNWVGLVIAAETANGNRSANARGQAAVTIRVAMQPPIRLRRSGASCGSNHAALRFTSCASRTRQSPCESTTKLEHLHERRSSPNSQSAPA